VETAALSSLGGESGPNEKGGKGKRRGHFINLCEIKMDKLRRERVGWFEENSGEININKEKE